MTPTHWSLGRGKSNLMCSALRFASTLGKAPKSNHGAAPCTCGEITWRNFVMDRISLVLVASIACELQLRDHSRSLPCLRTSSSKCLKAGFGIAGRDSRSLRALFGTSVAANAYLHLDGDGRPCVIPQWMACDARGGRHAVLERCDCVPRPPKQRFEVGQLVGRPYESTCNHAGASRWPMSGCPDVPRKGEESAINGKST